MPAVSLTDLQLQITQREQELHALRQELKARQSQFTQLSRRKEELQHQLQQVEEEIAALGTAASQSTEQSSPAVPVAPPLPGPAASTGGQTRLGELIVTMLHENRKPMTARQLNEEAQRRDFQPSGQNPLKSVEARLHALKKQHIVQRAAGQPGYVLVPSANGDTKEKSKPAQTVFKGTPKAATKSASAVKKTRSKGSSSSGPAQRNQPASHGEQPPLREVLTGILQNSRKPLSAAALAEQILASGYRTDSKKFVKVVRSQLRKMANVELLPDKSYRLQKKS